MSSVQVLSIPTPFAIGDVNCYLVDDDPLTLVDCGPDTAAARAALTEQLAGRRRRVADLERVVITHQHIDHGGGADWIQRESGAEILCFGPLVPLIKAYDQACEDDDLFAVGVMAAHGVDTGIANELHALTQGAHVWATNLHGEATGLADGDVIEFGARTWRAWHRPGHSPSDMVFHDERTGELIGGDHLLAKVSSNPIVHKPLDGSSARPRSLMTYIDSLNETRAMDVTTVHGGHGEPVGDHVALIDERLRLHDRRARKIERALHDGRAMSAHQIARELWGEIAVKEAYLTLSETLGHLDLLVADGRAVEHDSGDAILYSAP